MLNGNVKPKKKILFSLIFQYFIEIQCYCFNVFHTINSSSSSCLSEDTTGVRKCLDVLSVPCSKSKIKAIKVIRFTMAQLQKLLEIQPDTKVIHLIRDPRGSLHSQSRVGQFLWRDRENLINSSINHCNRVYEDLVICKELKQKYPNQILTVRYEEIAEYPQTSSEYLYNFLGIEMLDKIRKYIWEITFAGKAQNCQICTTRTNATETAYKWRSRMKFEEAEVVQKECAQVFKEMGYREYHSKEELLDEKLPSRYEEFGDGYMTMKHSTIVENSAKSGLR